MTGIMVDYDSNSIGCVYFLILDFSAIVDGNLVSYASYSHLNGLYEYISHLCQIILENKSDLLVRNPENETSPYLRNLLEDDLTFLIKCFLSGSTSLSTNAEAKVEFTDKLLSLLHSELANHLAPTFEYGLSFVLRSIDPMRRSALAESIAIVGGPSIQTKEKISFRNHLMRSVQHLGNYSEYHSASQIGSFGLAKIPDYFPDFKGHRYLLPWFGGLMYSKVSYCVLLISSG